MEAEEEKQTDPTMKTENKWRLVKNRNHKKSKYFLSRRYFEKKPSKRSISYLNLT